MFIVTTKLPRRRLALGTAAAALVCCAALALFPASSPSQREDAPGVEGVGSNGDRIAFLNAYGWEVEEEPASVEEIQMPDTLGEEYGDYLALQLSQGFDLEAQAGRRLKRYSYRVTNYPTGETDVLANLLLRGSTVVGGEVLSPEMDGFLHGLTMPRLLTSDGQAAPPADG